MKTEKINIQIDSKQFLSGILWLPEGTLKATLQIAHGMTEHIGRYTALAEYLTSQGIAVVGYDLRGHGTNPSEPNCASFGDGGWEASLEDMHQCYVMIEQRFQRIPHFLLGFSLGSFLVREYLNSYDDEVAGAIIVGTGHQSGALLSVMMAIVKTQIKKVGFDKTTPLVQKLSFETYNQKFAPNCTPSDWLCSDEKELDKYRVDKLCRADISAGLFLQLLGAMKRTGSAHAYDNWRKDMPILLLSGRNDPVGDGGKGVERVKAAMKKAGLEKVAMKLFDGARHDLLHEEKSGCAAEARAIIMEWLAHLC
jgi:alpha-beta hydrolase superfamily lysophospholipase